MPTAVDDATLVHIAVRKVGNKYELGVYPCRSGETNAFRTTGNNPRRRERPREVVWEGHDIPAGMKLKIVVKNNIPNEDKGLLPQPDYEIVANDTPVRSGAVLLKPDMTGGRWAYDIFLVDANATSTSPNHGWIDPDIDIHPDP